MARGLATVSGGSTGIDGCEEFLCNSDLAFSGYRCYKIHQRELCPKKPTCRVAISGANLVWLVQLRISTRASKAFLKHCIHFRVFPIY